MSGEGIDAEVPGEEAVERTGQARSAAGWKSMAGTLGTSMGAPTSPVFVLGASFFNAARLG